MNKIISSTTKVLTSNGYIHAGKLEVGDIVYDYMGKAQKVRRVSPTNRMTRILKYNDGTEIRCTGNSQIAYYDSTDGIVTVESIDRINSVKVRVMKLEPDKSDGNESYLTHDALIKIKDPLTSEVLEQIRNKYKTYAGLSEVDKHCYEILKLFKDEISLTGRIEGIVHLKMAYDIQDCLERLGLRVTVNKESTGFTVKFFTDVLEIVEIRNGNREEVVEISVSGLTGTFVMEHCVI